MAQDTAHTARQAATGCDIAVIEQFLRNIQFVRPQTQALNTALEEDMRAEMHARNIACPQLEATLHCSAGLAELAYCNSSFEERKYVALYTWYCIYVDDMISRDKAPCLAFEERFLRGLPQLDPVLSVLADLLRSTYHHYSPLAANTIVSSTLDFITGNCLEQEVGESCKLRTDVKNFPWFMRNLTGVAWAYAHMCFPKSTGVRTEEYIQAMSDMNFWIAGTNDLLSFHKEELAGETANYVHNRAFVETKSALDVIVELERELSASLQTIRTVVGQNPRVADIWRAFETGYAWWHIQDERYKLKDIQI